METPTKSNPAPENPDKTMETPTGTPEKPQEQMGGRKKSRKVNPALKSWVKFVKKIQHEEKITYPEAMKRASKRKSEWQRGGDGETIVEEDTDVKDEEGMMGGRRRRSRRSRKQRGGEGEVVEEDTEVDEEMMGGRRRRSRRSRKQRGGNVSDFDSDWKQYGKVGGRRSRRHRR